MGVCTCDFIAQSHAIGCGVFLKDAQGTVWLEGRKRRAERKAAEDKAMREAKKRDGNTCRVPGCEHMPKKPRIECAHLEHRGMGGNPSGDRTQIEKLIALCFIHHAEFDKQMTLDFHPVDPLKGTNGPCAWFRADKETGEMVHFATEKSVGVSEARS